MTDKQIMIDGVDVSGCKYIIDYDPPEWQGTWGGAIHKGACRRHSGDCKCNPNCYYKQLKRKEQECEELKEGYSELTEIVAPYMDDFTGYNEELGGFDIVLCVKELMEQIEAYKMEAEEGKEINAELNAELEQEKALKETYIACYKAKHEDIEGELFNLKAENDELNTINARLLGRLEVDETDTSLVFNLDKELRQKEKEFYTAIQKVVKLKQTLTEIKEIAEGVKVYDPLAKQILQKISEVEDEHNG